MPEALGAGGRFAPSRVGWWLDPGAVAHRRRVTPGRRYLTRYKSGYVTYPPGTRGHPGDTPGPPEPASAGVGAAVDGVAGPAEAPDLGLDGVAGPRADGVGVAGSPESDRGELPDATVAAVVDDELAGLLGAAAGYVAAAKAANTRTAYASDWARFAGWCADRELAALPAAPATLGAYLTAAALSLIHI